VWPVLVCAIVLSATIVGQDKKPKILAVTGARLIDGTGAAPIDDAVIVITGQKFSAVGPRARVTIPPDAEVIDVRGSTVIPGLIDAHIHVTWAPSAAEAVTNNAATAAFRAADLLRRCLMVGVTTVRDAASFGNVGIMARRAFEDGTLVGSRPIVSGQGVSSTGGHGTEGGTQGLVVEVNGPDGFRAGVRSQLKAGADFIKVLCPFTREEVQAAVQEAHLHEKTVTVHPSLFKAQFDFLRWAVDAGPDGFEHAYAVPDDLIPKIAEKKMYCVPTLSVLRLLANQYRARGPEWDWKVKKYVESEEIFRKLRRAGVKMAVGTDAVTDNMVEYPGLMFKETEEFVELGYSPMEAIVAATKVGADVSDAADRLGTIAVGKLADVVVLERDPLANIANLRTAQIVVQGGRIVKR
jgi:imidazolonepropionase-like amidohydrolase